MSQRALSLLGAMIFLIVGGTIFFRWVEGWSWVDAYFFTVVTLSTVGYGVPVPETALGKIATTIFIFVGLGIFALAIQTFAQYSLQQREESGSWLTARLRRRRKEAAPEPPEHHEHRG